MMSKGVGLLFFLFLFVTTSKGQIDSVPHVQVPPLVQKVADVAEWGVDLVTFEKEKYTFFLLPIAGYEERTMLQIGVMPAWRFYLGGKDDANVAGVNVSRPSDVSASIAYATAGMYEFDLSSNVYTRNNWYVYNKWLYQSMPDRFYPIGNDVNKDLSADIDKTKLEFLGRVMKGVGTNWFVGLNYDVGIYDVKEQGEGLLNSNVVGFNGGSVVGAGPAISYDSRNSIVFPNTGSYIGLEYAYYPEALSDFSFSILTFDARKFFKLGEGGKVMATQFYMKSSGGDVPFYRLPVLGGKNLFRGISHPYKYMDKNSMYLQAAYRSPLWWRLGYEVFAGTGRVFDQWDSSILDGLHLMGGLGLRVTVLEDEHLSFRFDYGISTTGDTGFFFTLGEAF